EKTYEYRFMSADGRYVWMHDMLRLIRDPDGNPVEVVGSLTDITARKEMEAALQKKGEEQQSLIKKLQEAHEQLLQSEKMASVGQLAAGIAHEINNPVGFVNSNMGSLQSYVGKLFEVIDQYEALLKTAPPSPATLAQIKKIREAADLEFLKDDVEDLVRESMDGLKRVKDIVQSLKDFSHVGETDWQEADIHQGIDSTLNIVKNEIKYKATVVKEYGQLPAIKCIISQLNQVFMNLLVNASHAIKESGTITVSTGCQNDWVWIRISDTGSGIPPENLNRIFEPFFTTKPVGSGTGLGLSLSYGIVKKHGGRIDVQSEVGKGTSFTVHLPVRQDNPA
ncbi:MAG: PAS domain S-box protein, partial [Burkholderiales bacterium]|nr:PAS domain S-box protein [Burkholderiales bacterium]